MADATGVLSQLNLNSAVLRQIGLMVGIAASVAIGVAVVLWSQSPSYRVLYGSIPEQDVTQILEALQTSGIDYKLDESSGAVMVPADKVYQARIKLASQGLPKTNSIGFELLDKQQGFGTSQFIEQTRFQRALEGELASSIGQLDSVKTARVHLAIPKQSVFVRDKKEPSASVLVDLHAGRVLDAGQVSAITHLVSASVPNLKMSAVTVVDQQGHLLTQTENGQELTETARRFDYNQKVEQSYIDRIEKIIGPIVGYDGVKAQVTAELDFTTVEQTSENYDPDRNAIRSEQVSEDQRNGSPVMGIPGALSNQPPLDAATPETTGNPQNPPPPALDANGQPLPAGQQPAQGQSTTPQNGSSLPGNSRKQQTRNYELDKVISHSRQAIGTIKRLSAAVVVNNRVTVDATGKSTTTQRTPEEIERITNLVKEAIGFNAARGDTVNVINADFNALPVAEVLPETPIWQQPWFWEMAKQVSAGLMILFLVLGILRPSLKTLLKRDEPKEDQLALAAAAGEAVGALPGAEDSEAGDAGTQALGSDAAADNQEDSSSDKAARAMLQLLPPLHDLTDLEAVKNYVLQEPKLTAQVLKNWLEAE